MNQILGLVEFDNGAYIKIGLRWYRLERLPPDEEESAKRMSVSTREQPDGYGRTYMRKLQDEAKAFELQYLNQPTPGMTQAQVRRAVEEIRDSLTWFAENAMNIQAHPTNYQNIGKQTVRARRAILEIGEVLNWLK